MKNGCGTRAVARGCCVNPGMPDLCQTTQPFSRPLHQMNETGSIEHPRCGETESGRSGHDNFQQRDDFGNFEANLRFLDATQALQPRPPLLEIGCGKGRLIKHLLDAGHDVRGYEVNLLMLDESRRLYGPLPIDPVDGTALPYPTATFDIVLSFDVFEHIPDSDAHLMEVRRLLRSGGRYLLQTPNKWTNSVFETIRWRSLTAWRQDIALSTAHASSGHGCRHMGSTIGSMMSRS